MPHTTHTHTTNAQSKATVLVLSMIRINGVVRTDGGSLKSHTRANGIDFVLAIHLYFSITILFLQVLNYLKFYRDRLSSHQADINGYFDDCRVCTPPLAEQAVTPVPPPGHAVDRKHAA
jgi:hypothetical protein